MAVNVEKHIAHWMNGAEEAWKDAEALIEKKRYSFSGFVVHLALEKALKAHVTRETGTVPPKTHDLLVLARLSGLQISAEHQHVLQVLNDYQLAARYPQVSRQSTSSSIILQDVADAKGVYGWLKQQL